MRCPKNEWIFEGSLGRQKSMDVSPGAAQGGQKGPRVLDEGGTMVSVLAGWLPGLASRARLKDYRLEDIRLEMREI